MSKKKRVFKRWSNKWIETAGLILLLLSFGWQTFEEDINSLSNDVDTYQVHEKLDKIWSVLTDLYSHSDANTSNTHVLSSFDVELNGWKYWGDMLKEKERVDFQSKLFGGIRIGLYLIGSFLLIVPKFRKEDDVKLAP